MIGNLLRKPLKEEISMCCTIRYCRKVKPGGGCREDIATQLGVARRPSARRAGLLVSVGLAEQVPTAGAFRNRQRKIVEAYAMRLLLESAGAMPHGSEPNGTELLSCPE
jgi:hypothetical protein